MNRKYLAVILITMLSSCNDTDSKKPSDSLNQLSSEKKIALDKANHDPVFSNTDMGLWVRGSSLVQIINSINSIPNENRLVSVQLTDQTDKLIDAADYYVELYDLPKNNAAALIEYIESAWTSEGRLLFKAHLKVHGNANIHGHYKPLKIGGHAGFSIDTKANIRGQVILKPSSDPNKLFEADFELLSAPLTIDLHSNISDHKEWCWQFNLPFGGEAKDCKILWQYNIPINLSKTIDIKTDNAISLPIAVNLPSTIRLQNNLKGLKFDKSIHVDIIPKGFKTDNSGLLLSVEAKVTETQ